MMNPAIGKPFIGMDNKDRQISGIIRHVAGYGKSGAPAAYLVQLYPDGGRLAGCAIVDAQTVNRHVDGIALVESINKEAE